MVTYLCTVFCRKSHNFGAQIGRRGRVQIRYPEPKALVAFIVDIVALRTSPSGTPSISQRSLDTPSYIKRYIRVHSIYVDLRRQASTNRAALGDRPLRSIIDAID
ncbi:hypothetical protein VTO73DRAFT_10190 [Trametes versicolor]